MISKHQVSSLFLPICIFLIIGCSATHGNSARSRLPCKEMIFYMHDIIYNGRNLNNATSAIIAAPAWGNKTVLADNHHFGDMIVFDDPITLDNNLHSPPIGRAQGFYIYDKKEVFTSWFGFSCVFNSTTHQGSINFAGANPQKNKTRNISVIGGTDDFFMARGVATIMTDSVEGRAYFRIRIGIKFYECW